MYLCFIVLPICMLLHERKNLAKYKNLNKINQSVNQLINQLINQSINQSGTEVVKMSVADPGGGGGTGGTCPPPPRPLNKCI